MPKSILSVLYTWDSRTLLLTLEEIIEFGYDWFYLVFFCQGCSLMINHCR